VYDKNSVTKQKHFPSDQKHSNSKSRGAASNSNSRVRVLLYGGRGLSFQDLESGGPLPGWGANGEQDPSQSAAAGVFQVTTAVSTFERLVNTLSLERGCEFSSSRCSPTLAAFNLFLID